MAKFVVKGARKSDAQTVMFNVEANTAAEAQERANRSGVVVESVQAAGGGVGLSERPVMAARLAAMEQQQQSAAAPPTPQPAHYSPPQQTYSPPPPAYAPPPQQQQQALGYAAAPMQGAAPSYTGLLIASFVLRCMAVPLYLAALVALYVAGRATYETLTSSSAYLAGVDRYAAALAPLLVPIAIAANAALVHAIGSGCRALRDIARNSYR